MHPRWVIVRWLGLLAFLFLAVWVGERLAGADGTVTPPPDPRAANTPTTGNTASARTSTTTTTVPRRPPPPDAVSTTPPGFPFGPAGG